MKKSELLSKATECVLLGHQLHGYFVEDVNTKRRFVSCHVRFVNEPNSGNSCDASEQNKARMIQNI